MKKQEKKTDKKQVSREKRPASKPDVNDLGAYGLEPPKIYRQDQSSVISQRNEARKQQREIKKNTPKTTQQQRAIQNKKRKQKKITRKIILYASLVVGIALVIIVLSLTVFFKTQTISISGNNKYSKKEISAVLPIQKDKNLFLADTSSAEEKLEENLPYIYNAEIKRKLPSTIIVNIEETPQVYAIKEKDKTYTLLDDNFKVVEKGVKKKPKKAILIKKSALASSVIGKEAEFTNKKTSESLRLMIDEMKKLELKKVTELYSADINNNYYVYASRITIKLGSTDDIEEKIYSALAAIEKLEEQNPLIEGELTVGTDKQVYFTEK